MATIRLYYGRDNDVMIQRLRQAQNEDIMVSTLEVRETILEEDVIEAIVDLLLARHLETVQLDDCGAYLNKQSIRMARALGNVRNVRLSEPTFLSQFFLEHMLMSAKKLTQLRIQDHLDCRQVEALAKGLKSNSSVKILDLSRSRLDSFAILADGLRCSSSLEVLKMRSLGLDDQQVDEILTKLKDHSTIRYLDLSFNHCRNVDGFAELLKGTSKIQELHLGYQNVWQAPKLDIRGLANAILSNTMLEVLSLARNKLSDSDAVLLGDALLGNKTLKSLDVRENRLSDEGIVALANSIENGSGLQRLAVLKNNYDVKGALALLSAAKKNINFVHVEVADHGCMAQQIRYCVALNRGGRRLLLENPSLSLWPFALERVNKIDWIGQSGSAFDFSYTSYQLDVLLFLLKGPALFEGIFCTKF